jgi:hypothetical protein
MKVTYEQYLAIANLIYLLEDLCIIKYTEPQIRWGFVDRLDDNTYYISELCIK